MIAFGRDVLGDFEVVTRREWLVTNGLGGFACSTLAGLNTRRYHGLLVAALRPPLERTLLVAKLDVTATYLGQRYELATNEFLDGTVAPRGHVHLESFHLDGTLPVWTWLLGDARLEQRLWMQHGANITYVSFRLLRASGPVELKLTPLCAYRDYHWHQHGGHDPRQTSLERGVRIEAHEGARAYRVVADRGEYHAAPAWYWHFKHRAETERGLDDAEDLFRPGCFTLTLARGEVSYLTLAAEEGEGELPGAARALENERARQAQLLAACAAREPAHQQLVLAADQFIVERHLGQATPPGRSVIAGYPWFGDWGRDTMIALPGLTLATGRIEVTLSILRTFAGFVSEGMLPNRFPDVGEMPEYNTVDATLWYFVAVDEYLRRSRDREFLEEIYPVLRDIVTWQRRGTRYGIRVDPADGLLHAGEEGTQLTWMDAKVGDWVVTPRTGKAVEINALWFNALVIMSELATALGESKATQYVNEAARVQASFKHRFWYGAGNYLYDVIDTPHGDDASLRPNQIFAVALRHRLLDAERTRAVVDTCMHSLWTPVGLRSLAPSDARYTGTYRGSARERDGAYHQGTVWSWLLGPFALAHYRVYGRGQEAREYLQGLEAHLRDGCVGQISEIFDGNVPHTPRGCFAQAWGVAELLRAWSEIDEGEASDGTRLEQHGVAVSRR